MRATIIPQIELQKKSSHTEKNTQTINLTNADLSDLSAIAARTKQAIHDFITRELSRMDAEIDKFVRRKTNELNRIETPETRQKHKLKFGALFEYFRMATDSYLTFTFDELGEIIGEPLCDSAYRYREYWTRRGRSRLADCWYANGYKIKKLDLVNKYVTFYRVNVEINDDEQ